MKTSPSGRQAISEREGCRLRAYQDGAGVWTIGVGHTRGVTKDAICTDEQAQQWLTDDLADAEADVARLVTAPLNQNQFDALVSFTFNLGAPALARSTLLRMLNAGNYAGAAGQFKVWCMVDGHPSQGIVNRRASETAQFTLGES